MHIKHIAQSILFAALACTPLQAVFANQYPVPAAGNDLIGDVIYNSVYTNNTLLDIGQHYNVGYNAMQEANPGHGDAPLPSGAVVTVPSQFVLPPLPRKGIIVNLAEMRMYYFPEGSNEVLTFPVGIGKVGKTVPTGATFIARKVVNPTWTPPEDIREFDRQQGIELPRSMGPGPDNPLGPYALYLKVPTYLIHSTIFPESIGRRASFGCIRMNESDIKQFFPLVRAKTPVMIVDIPDKVGWNNGKLYLESHVPLEEHDDGGVAGVVNTVERALPANETVVVNWQLVTYIAEQRDGMPHEIGYIAQK